MTKAERDRCQELNKARVTGTSIPWMDPVWRRLERALQRNQDFGDRMPLARWFEREVDPSGLPVRLSPECAPAIVALLKPVLKETPEWSQEIVARFEALHGTVATMARGNGSIVFSTEETRRARMGRSVAKAHSRASLSQVFGVLRANPTSRSDLLAVRQSDGETADFELEIGGAPGFRGRWQTRVGEGGTPATSIKPRVWKSTEQGDYYEWAMRARSERNQRSVAFLRHDKLAILADLVTSGEPTVSQIVATNAGGAPDRVANTRAFKLRGMGAGQSIQIASLSLPCLDYPTERGAVEVGPGQIEFRHDVSALRRYLPIVVSWDAARNRRAPSWRMLTVTQARKVCSSETAFAARIEWPGIDGFVFYQSFTRPVLRCFLGHQTRARVLVGQFTKDGAVEPLVQIDD